MSKKSPQLRFEGFTDDWEQRKLNEVSDIYDGTHQTPKYQDDGVMFLSVENIKTLTSNKFISREAFEDEFKIRPQRGDVLMTRIGDIGTANVVETDEDLAYYVSLALFKSEELNPYFLQASIYAPFVQDQIWKRTLHIAFPKKINKNEIGQVPINVPTLAEQTKIGSFFKQLDNTITLHQRKLDLLKEQKKGYLQKMFPKNGEKVPELRFAGFADDWEERKLSDIADRFDNLRVPITASDRKPGDTPYYGANGIQDYVEGFTHNGEFILVAEDGANDLKNYPVQYVNGKVWVNNHAHVLQGKKTITDNKFLMNAIKNFNIEPFLVGGGRAKLNADVMMKLNILLPTFVEQEKIGSLFSLLDKTIALHQRKLDLLKEQKKGYLQKMFPKNGAKVPELRFAGFADDWEQRKLSGIIEKLSGGASIKPTDYLEDGIRTIPKGAVNATGIADLSGSKYISEDFFEKNITSHAHTSNLVTSLRDLVPSAPNMGRIVRIEGDDEQFLMPQGVYKLELFEGMDGNFLISFSNSDKYRKIISAEKNGSTQVHIRNGEFLNIDINLPSEHEQKKIGSFFKQLDNTIALHQRKLDLLKEQKKGFLQKMFV